MLRFYVSQFFQCLTMFVTCVKQKLMLIFVGLFFSNLALADTADVKNLLSEMSEAVRTLNYQGRFMYLLGSDTSSFQIQHAVIKGKEHERLVFLNQKQQEVVRVGHDTFCIHAGNHLLGQHKSISANPFADKLSNLGKGIENYYHISLSEEGMVAGRDTYQISFKSKDNNRYDHLLWIDTQSKLLLKANVSDTNLGTLESFEYVQIDIGQDIPASTFTHNNYVQHKPKHFDPTLEISDEGNAGTEQTKWQASWLPEGFYFSGAAQQSIHSKEDAASEKNHPVDMLMYTDGIAAITIFIEARDKTSKFAESSQKGAVSAYSHALLVDEHKFMITVVGEVPLQTVERVAKGINVNSFKND